MILLTCYKKLNQNKCVSGRKAHLEQHIKSVHELYRPFACQLCTYKTARQRQLKQHIEMVHHKVR